MPMVLERRAGGAKAHGGVRRQPLLDLRDGRTRPRLYEYAGRPGEAARGVARRGGPRWDADRSAPVAGGGDRIVLPGVHGGEGSVGAGGRRRGPLPPGRARGPDVLPAQARHGGSARRGGAARAARRGALPGRPRLPRDRRGVRGGPRGDARGRADLVPLGDLRRIAWRLRVLLLRRAARGSAGGGRRARGWAGAGGPRRAPPLRHDGHGGGRGGVLFARPARAGGAVAARLGVAGAPGPGRHG